MAEQFRDIFTAAHQWIDRGREQGWLSSNELERFARVEEATPGDLFTGDQPRPLVVALFGGTGVGKSSLLNRLAGEPIAETGVQRPTSHDATVFVHESVELAKLPADLPVDQVRVQRHRNDDRRGMLWIDAPDIDSVHESNRELALAWLPHVDLLIYVVSPERYRDDVGWRVLKQRGHRHGWMFVMNRWDEGDARQRTDFLTLLAGAGFDSPILFCTTCAQNAKVPDRDEFPLIEETINTLLAEHGLAELERLGQRARLEELAAAIESALPRTGTSEQWHHIASDWQQSWEHIADSLLAGAELPIRTVAGRVARQSRSWAQRTGQFIERLLPWSRRSFEDDDQQSRRGPGEVDTAGGGMELSAHRLKSLAAVVWDEWADKKLATAADKAEVRLRRAGIAAEPLRRRMAQICSAAPDDQRRRLEDALRTTLAKPGTPLQRAAVRIFGMLTLALPIVGLLWVAARVIGNYYLATRGQAPDLGMEFILSSAALVLVMWLLPFLGGRIARPRLDRLAQRTLHAALQSGLTHLHRRFEQALHESRESAQAYRQAGAELAEALKSLTTPPRRTGISARLIQQITAR